MSDKGMTKKRRERAAQALQLREQGMTYDAIAKELGVSRTTAFDDVKDSLHEIIREPAEDLRDLELSRLDGMLGRLNTELAAVVQARRQHKLSADKAAQSVARIVDGQLRVSDRRSQLLGLDSPQKIELGGNVDLDATVDRIMAAATLAMQEEGDPESDESSRHDGMAPR